ncbi:MAG: hypothetical protein ETSY2_11955, partial [Candidatus Entotheonella gemina]
QWHAKALEVSGVLGSRPLITTEWVLAEFLAFFSAAGEQARRHAAERARLIFDDPNIRVLSASEAPFLEGLALYESRLDKGYSLADCISMNVMWAEGIIEALTNDHHFTQEGFRILLQ